MSDVFISYARSTAKEAQRIAETLRALGYGVWRDDELPAHRAYAEVIEERLQAAKAVVVIWSAEAVKSEWVQSEADTARTDHKLVQLTVDGTRLPRPFDRIQCADLVGWTGDPEAPGWRKVAASIADLVGGAAGAAPALAEAALPLPGKPSIAVMPFANLSGDPEQEYFADGMVVEIVEALSRIKSIFVIASSSTLSFKGKAVAAPDAARQLGVRYVLEGSVRKAANRVRIGVQLIDAADGVQIWTRRFEDTLEDVFTLQDTVALSVAGVIEPMVESAETRRADGRSTDNMGSYDLCLRAMSLARSYLRDDVLAGLTLAERAIALDPQFGMALGLATRCHTLIDLFGWSDDPEDNRRQGIGVARRALKAAGDDATVLASAAVALASLERDLDGAIAMLERATALNPGSSAVWMMSGDVRLRAGQADVGVEHIETSMRLDPLGPNRPMQMVLLAVGRFEQGRFGDAIAGAKVALQLVENPGMYAMLAACYGHLGQPEAASEALVRYRALSPRPADAFFRATIHNPEALQPFLDGIALAEGKSRVDGPAGAQ